MTITGYYSDIHNNIITVTMTKAGEGEPVTISEDDNIKFAGEGITITENIDDVFDEIITSTCSIELFTKDYIGDLFFTKSPKEMTCTITKTYDGTEKVIFDGYIAPAAFNQPYYMIYDKFTLTAVDKLSVLQYYYYKDIYSLTKYNEVVGSAGLVSFESLLNDVFGVRSNWDWDESKDVDLADLYISENEILGESYDDVWTKQEILEEICRFLGLHARQDGTKFYLFSWQSEKKGSTYVIDGDNIMASDMDITIDDVYSQIQVKDNVTPIDTIVNSPLEDDQMYSPFSSAQKFLTEYIADGEGVTAQDAIKTMLEGTGDISHEGEYDNVKPHRNEWYFQIKQSSQWELYDSNGNNVNSFVETENSKGINQHNVLKKMRQRRFTPMLISMGANKDIADNNPAPLKKPNLSNYLVISVNGGCDNSTYDNDLKSIMDMGGMARYNGFSATNLAPVDKQTTNYLIFSGKITMAPVAFQSGTNTGGSNPDDNLTFSNISPLTGHTMWTVPSDNNNDGRFYYHRFWEAKYPNNTSTTNLKLNDNMTLIYPDAGVKKIVMKKPYYRGGTDEQSPFIYKYANEKERINAGGYDPIKKLPILACRLMIKDGEDETYLVENYDTPGQPVYDWVKKEDLAPVEGGGYRDYFTIGIDPNAGDCLLGQQFEIQDNTRDYGLDATGMAVPIHYGLPLAGRVEFSILGPVNLVWDSICVRKEGNFWRHTSYTTEQKNVLDWISNIWIEDFKCTIYTDNGYTGNKDDSDIYYVSDTQDLNNDYIAGKHETEFRIITQLTSEECLEMDVKNTVNVNSVLDGNKNTVNTFKDNNTGFTRKAEEHYVNEYYDLTSDPKMIITVTVKDDTDLTRGKLYGVYNMGKDFILLSKTYDLKYDRVNIRMREI